MSDKQPIDPDIVKTLLARSTKRRKPSLLPTIVVGIILFNIFASVLDSEQLSNILPFAAFALLWIGIVVVPKIRKQMKAVSEAVKQATENPTQNPSSISHSPQTGTHQPHRRPVPEPTPKHKHCKSCDIKHSADTRYCRRCGAPLLR